MWPYQCHRFVSQSFRVHEVSLATMRSIARPTVQRLAATAAAPSCNTEKIKADQRRHVVRSVSPSTCARSAVGKELFPSSFPVVFALFGKWNTALEVQYWCDISPFSWKRPWGPFESFLCTLLSQIFPDSDLSQPIGTLAWTGQSHWFPIPSWHNNDCQRTSETCPWPKCNPHCSIKSNLQLPTSLFYHWSRWCLRPFLLLWSFPSINK